MLLDKAMRKALTPILESLSKMLVLDVGCGIGRWTKIISNKNSVVGVDISRFMIKMAKDSCKGENCSFLVADASFLPFKDKVFDLVVSITVLQHILEEKKFAKALSEIAGCGKSEALIAEEMWSDKETLLKNVYCPIRILPVELYAKRLLVAGLHAHRLWGITPAPLAILLARLFRSISMFSEGLVNVKFKASVGISKLVHFAMGIGILSAIFTPKGHYNPSLSLHTIILAKKQGGQD
jgi:SAM-dependent methyltransferase